MPPPTTPFRDPETHRATAPASRPLGDHLEAAILGAAFAAALGVFAWSSSARASEYASFTGLPLPDGRISASMMVVTEPAGWQSGDGMALLVVGAPDRGGLRGSLVSELLQARVAVAEITIAADLDDAAAVAADLHDALRRLGSVMRPGPVRLFGFGWDPSGRAVIEADQWPLRAGAPSGPYARFAGHVCVGPGCAELGVACGPVRASPTGLPAGAAALACEPDTTAEATSRRRAASAPTR